VTALGEGLHDVAADRPVAVAERGIEVRQAEQSHGHATLGRVPAPLPATLVVNTRNAAGLLEACLGSCADWFTEVLVADMQSDDGTPEVARRLGARVLELPNAGYVEPGRQPAIEAASQPWVFILDADERPTPGLRAVLERAVASDVAAVRIPRRNVLFGRWVRGAGYWPDRQPRLLRRGHVRWPPEIHQWPQVDGRTEDAPADPAAAIEHDNYATVGEWLRRNDRYTDFEVDRAIAAGRRPSLARLLAMPPAYFVLKLVRQGGWRDGWHGLVIATLMACYAALVEVKLWERLRASPSSS
jgi:glycosyltransferase involved in cell wall biosynthesis